MMYSWTDGYQPKWNGDKPPAPPKTASNIHYSPLFDTTFYKSFITVEDIYGNLQTINTKAIIRINWRKQVMFFVNDDSLSFVEKEGQRLMKVFGVESEVQD